MLLYIFFFINTFFSLRNHLIPYVLGSGVTPTPTIQQPTSKPQPTAVPKAQPTTTPKPQPTSVPKIQPTSTPIPQPTNVPVAQTAVTSIPTVVAVPTNTVNTPPDNGTNNSSSSDTSSDNSSSSDTSSGNSVDTTDTNGGTSQDTSSTVNSGSGGNVQQTSNTTTTSLTPAVFYNLNGHVIQTPTFANPPQRMSTPQANTLLEPVSVPVNQEEKTSKEITPYKLIQIYTSFVLSRISNLLSF